MTFRNMITQAWALRFGIPGSGNRYKILTPEVCCQLSQCKDDEARRLILGRSE
jgi:hypothetical protein